MFTRQPHQQENVSCPVQYKELVTGKKKIYNYRRAHYVSCAATLELCVRSLLFGHSIPSTITALSLFSLSHETGLCVSICEWERGHITD